MSQINVRGLTFGYEGGAANIFENVSFSIDTRWKLGFIGRNGRGKTTFLRLMLGRCPYQGGITTESGIRFYYFPFTPPFPDKPAREAARDCIAPFAEWEREMEEAASAEDMERFGTVQTLYAAYGGYEIDAAIEREAAKLFIPPDALDRPFTTLSGGEAAKLLIAALFLKQDGFYLIDEPTNHLDAAGRRVLGDYLASKQGFILVSHDRALLDRCTDHILCINRRDIEVQRGNYSSWEENRKRRDAYEQSENTRLQRDIGRLRGAAREKAEWSDRTERSKIGNHAADRGFIGHKAAKMMRRAKAIENRLEQAAADKEKLLQNIETADPLKLHPLESGSRVLIETRDLSVPLPGRELLQGLNFSVTRGERVALAGPNGCGKSTLVRLCLGEVPSYRGTIRLAGGLIISYVPQDTSFLSGGAREFAARRGLDESLFLAILRKLDFPREAFSRPMQEYSAGQKKKALLAASLTAPAHLYLWDEPLNYVDLLSRVQIENLLLQYRPTMLFVEHDAQFTGRVATRVVTLPG